MNTSHENAPALIAYQVQEVKDASYWVRIGAAWKNKKGGYQLKLTAFPVNGELVLLPPKEKAE